jgi:hypothetical protein
MSLERVDWLRYFGECKVVRRWYYGIPEKASGSLVIWDERAKGQSHSWRSTRHHAELRLKDVTQPMRGDVQGGV